MEARLAKNKEYWEGLIQEAINHKSELNDLDFKVDLPVNNERLKEHINAYAHTREGGSFVFGISDAGASYRYTGGALNFSDIQHKISNIAQNSQDPPVSVNNYIVKTSLGDVLCVHIDEGVNRPVFIKNRAPFGGQACFKRVAANTVPISTEEIRVMLAQSTHYSFDESAVQESNIRELDFKRIAEVFSGFQAKDGEDQKNINILLDNNIITKLGDKLFPTAAGLLIFGINPQSIKRFSNAYIEFQKFRDTTRASPIKKVEIKGNIQEQLEQSIDLLMQYLWVLPKIGKSGKRVEIPVYDLAVIREVMTNALVHRDYTKMYYPVKVALFKDRVEVENIGGLMPGLTVLNFVHKRDWRNPLMAQLTKKVGFGEMDGQGIDRIYSLSRAIQVPTPIFRDDHDSFTAILLGPKAFDELAPEQKRLSVIVLLIFEKIIDNEALRNNFDIKAEQASNLIKSMIGDGTIMQTNKSRKHAKYSLSEKYQEMVNS